MLRGGAGQTCDFCNRSPVCFCEKRQQTQSCSATAEPGVRPGRPEPPAKRAQPQASGASARATSGRTNQGAQSPRAGQDSDGSGAHSPLWAPPPRRAGLSPRPRWAQPAGRQLPRRVRSAPPGVRPPGLPGDRRRGHSGRGNALPVLCLQVRAAVPAGALGRIPRRLPFASWGPASGRRRAGGGPSAYPRGETVPGPLALNLARRLTAG